MTPPIRLHRNQLIEETPHAVKIKIAGLVFAIQSLFTSVSTTSPNLPDLHQEWKYHEVSAFAVVGFGFILAETTSTKNITSAFWTHVWCSLDRLLEHIPTICDYFAPGKSTSCSGHFGQATDQKLRGLATPLGGPCSSLALGIEFQAMEFSAIQRGEMLYSLQIGWCGCNMVWLWTMSHEQPNQNKSYLIQCLYECV